MASSRPSIICGNWKMYKTIDEAIAFIDKIIPIAETVPAEVLLAVPFTAIQPAAEKAAGTKVIIGAQNMNDADEGAFTGEIAASMLLNAGAQFVIVGHSERRKLFHETNSFINKKVKKALSSDLKPILCVGETYEEREQGKIQEVLHKQLTECLEGIEKGDFLVAYEPVWAIGTGKAATGEIAEEAHAYCREVLGEILGKRAAGKIGILYGGSVTPANAKTFLEQKNVDGLLIGSASLQPDSFAKILEISVP